MFRIILLAVDGSKYSEKAVELAKQLATAGDDEVVVAHVTELLPARFQTYPGLDSELDKEAIELTKGYVAGLEEAGITARAELRSAQYGGVARIITNLAEGMSPFPLSHEQTLKYAAIGAESLVKLILAYLKKVAATPRA